MKRLLAIAFATLLLTPAIVASPATAQDEEFELNILHINDHHSHLEADDVTLEIGGAETTIARGGFARVVAKIKELESSLDNVVKVHAGDATTGTLFYTSFEGQADAELMNQACFDVFAPGNHEFDNSDAGLLAFLDWLGAGDCETAVVSANVVPELGTPLAESSPTDYIEPYTISDVDGTQVGFIGITIAGKTQNSSSPLDTTQFLDEVESATAAAQELNDMGVKHIVVVSHYQYDNEIALAEAVPYVDVVVGGDSHTLLGDGFADYGLNPQGSYPTVVDGPEGTACVVQAWEFSKVVGELNVKFDADGNVTSCEGTPHMLLGDEITREVEGDDGDSEDVPLEGDELQAVLDAIDADPILSIIEPDAATAENLSGYQDEIAGLVETVIGDAPGDICIGRIPGDGRSEICSEEDTAVTGGDIQQLVTECFLNRSFEADIAIQNSGGVRIDVPAGDVTIATAYEILPFSNTMVNLEMTGEEIKNVVEQGASESINPDGSSGAYPYASGLRWDMDLSAPDGEKVSNLEVQARGESGWVPLDAATTYTVVTNSFAAGGGDSYQAFEDASDDGRATDTFLEYAQTFIDCVDQDLGGTIAKVSIDRYSTQSFIAEDGTDNGTVRTIAASDDEAADELPTTGSESTAVALLGLTILLAGFIVLRGSRRLSRIEP